MLEESSRKIKEKVNQSKNQKKKLFHRENKLYANRIQTKHIHIKVKLIFFHAITLPFVCLRARAF